MILFYMYVVLFGIYKSGVSSPGPRGPQCSQDFQQNTRLDFSPEELGQDSPDSKGSKTCDWGLFFFYFQSWQYQTFLPISGTLSDGGMLSATISWNTVRARRTVTPRETFSPESAGR